MQERNVCSKCQKSRSSVTSGFVTQFIDVCRCDAISIEQSQTISICLNCNLRIAKHSGSMTQWIFGGDKCECERPLPTEKAVEEFVNPSFIGYRDSKNETYIDMDEGSFPTERYLVIAELGRGAAGIVYLCRDKVLGKKVAVKTLLDLTAEQLISFQEEAKATAKLDHPNIVKILDFGASNSGTPYMVMDYIAGVSLKKYLAEVGILEESAARIVFAKLAVALEYSHNQGVFHRDIKPSNILLHETDEVIDVTLIDFGIAKVKEATGMITMYQDRTLAGTPAYMCPDPVRGDAYDRQSEIYCLGCVLFEALTRTPPFIGETALETLSMHINRVPPNVTTLNSSFSDQTDRIVSMCLEKQKSDRFTSMEQLATELNKVAGSKTIYTNVPVKKSLNKKFIVLLGFILTISIVGLVSFIKQESNKLPKKKSAIAKKTSLQIPIKTIDYKTLSKKLNSHNPTFTNFKFSRNDLHLLDSRKLKFLEFDYCIFDKKSFQFLGKVKSLDTLSLRSPQIDDFSIIPKIKGLRHLVLSKSRNLPTFGPGFTTEGYWSIDKFQSFEYLSKCKTLSKLTLENLVINRARMNELCKVAGLKSLVLKNCSIKNDNDATNKIGLHNLTKLKNLSELSITMDLSGESLEFIRGCRNLYSLELSNLSDSMVLLPDFGSNTKLVILRLHNANLEESHMEKIASIANLDALGLYSCNIKGAKSFQVLSRAKKLTNLFLSSTNIDEKCVSGFESMKLLQEITIRGYVGHIFKPLSKLKLKSVSIMNNSAVQEEDILRLAKTKSLAYLRIFNCKNIQRSLKDKIKKINPSCYIRITSRGLSNSSDSRNSFIEFVE